MVFKDNGNIFSTGKSDGFTSTQRKDSTLKGKVKCETESTLKGKVKCETDSNLKGKLKSETDTTLKGKAKFETVLP